MNRRMMTLLAMGAAGAMAFSAPGFAGNEYRNKYPTTTTDPASTKDCGEGDTVTYNGPLKMWPPNHKLQEVSVTATDGTSSNQVTLTVTPDHDEMAGGEKGDGGKNHDPDWQPGDLIDTDTGSATVGFWLRAERAGTGDGRVYTLDWVAEFDNGEKVCSSGDEGQSPFEVTVPHDMRGGANWK